jgi:Uma2 family endonuclease
MSSVSRPLTYEEWILLPTVEDGIEEVVKGEVRFFPPHRLPHAEIVAYLIEQLVPQVGRKRVGLYGSNVGQMISRVPLTCRSPDLVVFWRDKMVETDGFLVSPADLIVEVLTPTETFESQQEKLDDYESIRAPEVWLVSEKTRTVRVHLLVDGKLIGREFTEGELRPILFPGVSILLASIWPA